MSASNSLDPLRECSSSLFILADTQCSIDSPRHRGAAKRWQAANVGHACSEPYASSFPTVLALPLQDTTAHGFAAIEARVPSIEIPQFRVRNPGR